MTPIEVNWLAVIVSAVVSFVLGGLWYAPFIFGKVWQRLDGRTPEQFKAARPARAMMISFLTDLLTAYVMVHFLVYAGASNWQAGLTGAFWLWLGFVAAIYAANYAYGGKSVKLYAIDVGYRLVSLAAMGGILAGWR